jgi:rhodanese-related sulfurtransferase/polyisoprenoid-binding protein YceI
MNTGPNIHYNELKKRIDEGAVVIDVMTPEEFAACHMVGAQNACIYEMVFLDRIAEYIPNRNTELIVYDATGTTRTAEVARQRLIQAGYSNVSILTGGLAAWKDAGLPVEKGAETVLSKVELEDGIYRIDVEKSRLEWIGRNLDNRHFGQINILKGELIVVDRRSSAGNIVLDMRSIDNFDLEDPGYRDMLLRHLESDDFFAVNQFPTASFTLTGWEVRSDASPEAPGGVITGDLTIKDDTRSVTFPGIIAPQWDKSIKLHAAFDIDRTLWDVCYGSARYFEHPGMHLVHDLISLELFAIARRC